MQINRMEWIMTLIRWVVTGFLVSREWLVEPEAEQGGGHLLQFDGGARGNPGLGGAGAVILSEMAKDLKEVWSGYCI